MSRWAVAGAIYDPDNPFFFSFVRKGGKRGTEKGFNNNFVGCLAAVLSESHSWAGRGTEGGDLVEAVLRREEAQFVRFRRDTPRELRA